MPTLLIIYNTKTGNTELMAKAVEEGAKAVSEVDVNLKYHATPKELQEVDALVVGCPTYDHQMTIDIQKLLEKASASAITLKGKTAAAFGSFGWSGKAPGSVLEVLRNRFDMKTIEPPTRSKYRPDEQAFEECRKLGRKVAEMIR